MEHASVETVQAERCRWAARLEDETRAVGVEFALWGIKGKFDQVCVCMIMCKCVCEG